MATPNVCANCGVGHDPADVFCENCGYDFITGSLPGAPTPPVPAGAPEPEIGPGEAAPIIVVEVDVNREYFDRVVTAGELTFPEPAPEPQVVELPTSEAHIGRTSDRRGIHPDLDLALLTGDPAVSSRHAVLRRRPDGVVEAVDLGSTNGTIVGAANDPILEPDTPRVVAPGERVYVGAWTSIRLVEDAAAASPDDGGK